MHTTATPTNPNGFLIYHGPSLLRDHSPIVGIITLESTNRKTGNMAQLWVLRADIDPVSAVQTGCDSAICGQCPLRGEKGRGRGCYVNYGQAPAGVFKAYKRGAYPVASHIEIRQALDGRRIRLGAYWDPAALPISVLHLITNCAQSWTGYTHQVKARPHTAKYCMVSVESLDQARAHWKQGNRTFRVVSDYSEKTDREIICPADSTGAQCIDCGLCCGYHNGKPGSAAKSIVIKAHGAGASFVGRA